ncbi:MAG: hypothetical protein A2Z03_07880 [Chloroflexi bacterium RBG_16_56_8]|nr:MAG: hypothetical protein A2Z03_07880 [Chloroflexi bacterium RBG_16_56_8]
MDYGEYLRLLAKGVDYPPTPDIAGAVLRRLRPAARAPFMPRRMAWALAVILVLLSGMLLVPPARAALLEFIQIGAVRIFGLESAPISTIPAEELPVTMAPLTATPAAATSSGLENWAGETTLEDAQARAGFPILLPVYPADLGLPQHVYVQDMNGTMIIFVWLDPLQQDKVRMSLHAVAAGSWAIEKVNVKTIQETGVNGKRAAWVVGPYIVRMRNGDLEIQRLIEGHVLVWTAGDITYRLETYESLEEAIKIAESLKPMR